MSNSPSFQTGPRGDTPGARWARGARLGRYEVLLPLARGGMGEVLVARLQGGLGVRRLVVLKLLHQHLAQDPTMLRMFEREARIASRLHHPHIVAVSDVGECEAGPFLVMDFLASCSLLDLLRESGRAKRSVPPDVCAALLAEVCDGLHAAHELRDDDGALLNVVHRDCTPSNVLLDLEGRAFLTDFGVARARGASIEQLTTTSEAVRGKLGYLAPEQVRGEAVDRRCDLFAVGVMLHELLTGRRLFPPKENELAAMHAVLYDPIPELRSARPDCPEGLAAVAERLLSRDPALRYADAREVRDALLCFLTPQTDARRREFVSGLLSPAIRALTERVRAAEQALLSEGPDLASPTAPESASPDAHDRPGSRRSSRRGVLLLALGSVGALLLLLLTLRPWRAPPLAPTPPPALAVPVPPAPTPSPPSPPSVALPPAPVPAPVPAPAPRPARPARRRLQL